MTIRILLTQGYETVIDDKNKDLAENYKWQYSHGYAGRRWSLKDGLPRRGIPLHKVVLERKLGRPIVENMEPHHIDMNKLNNTEDNLEEVTHIFNCNNRSMNKNNTSGFTGVERQHDDGGWKTGVTFYGKKISLGTYGTPEEASKVRDDYIIKLKAFTGEMK